MESASFVFKNAKIAHQIPTIAQNVKQTIIYTKELAFLHAHRKPMHHLLVNNAYSVIASVVSVKIAQIVLHVLMDTTYSIIFVILIARLFQSNTIDMRDYASYVSHNVQLVLVLL